MAANVNSKSKTPGITLPSTSKQETVIRKAYARASLQLDQTDYVECHGTGTPVGDRTYSPSSCFAQLVRDD